MLNRLILFAFVPLLGYAHPPLLDTRAANPRHVPQKSGYKLTWADDFLVDTYKTSFRRNTNWIIDEGTGYQPLDGDIHPYNWGTGEIETMTDKKENLFTRYGNLYIVPRRDSAGRWTSGRIETRASWACDKGKRMVIEANINLNPRKFKGNLVGIWPAFWAMGRTFRDNGNAGWPETGEWDIMEGTNGLANVVGGVHCNAPACNEPSGLSRPMNTPNSRDGNFHKFGLIVDRTNGNWRQQSLTWTFDGKAVNKITGAQIAQEKAWNNLSQKPYFVILNVAVGGAYPNALYGSETPTEGTKHGLEATMVVDYVAVYKQK